MHHRRRPLRAAAALALALAAAPAAGQGAAPPAPAAPARPEASSALGDLLRLLVKRNYIAQANADALLAEEAADAPRAVADLAGALQARGQLGGDGAAAVTALSASPGGGASGRALAELVRVLLETQQITSAEVDALQVPDGVRRITYVPELVRAQLREEVKRDLLEQMKREGWASPRSLPEWTKRLTFQGDVRVRAERVMFKKGNANSGEFPDFNAINNGSPFDINFIDFANERYLDVDQNRDRARLRARLGLDAVASRDVLVVLRLASGDGSSPVSTNQTLGGSTGNFSKYQFWLDRAAIRWTPGHGFLTLDLGRFANPFFATDLIWSDNVNLDGLAVEASTGRDGTLGGFLTGGAFPVYNTALAFSPENAAKFKSRDKWLLAGQLGGEVRAGERLSLKLAAAYYDFRNVEGRPSSPCDTNLKGLGCDTDATRPAFAQNGNTYRVLRRPSDAALAAEATGPTPEYQYFGLATPFRELAVTGRAELRGGGLIASLDAELVRNTAFRPVDIVRNLPLNNRKSCSTDTCPYGGGNLGFAGRLTMGSASTGRPWDWSLWIAYKHLESDAVLDAFTDSDFGLGGTNLKGFVAGASICPAENLTLAVRWFSADQIVGPPYGVDLLQIDLTARY